MPADAALRAEFRQANLEIAMHTHRLNWFLCQRPAAFRHATPVSDLRDNANCNERHHTRSGSLSPGDILRLIAVLRPPPDPAPA
jgi:hypothetical protein